jgi:hypothetical protein
MLGGLLVPLSAQMDQRNYNDTHKVLEEYREALIGYAMSHVATDGHPYLPCPDTDGDGAENRVVASTTCTNVEGDVPWADLGLSPTDSWNTHYHYRVTQAFADSGVGFTLSSSGNITVRDASGGNIVASSVPVIVISRGKNGVGTGADETENSNNNTTFVSHTPSNTVGNVFDDLVVWVPSTILFNRVVAASRLP